MKITELITSGKAEIIDVRSHEEFMGGHAEGSINIPLQQLGDRLDELKAMNKPIVLCCASGNRSGMAESFLSRNGIECYNGGSWLDVNYLHNSKRNKND